jgi:uncharacterized integral membrane protein
VNTLRLIVGFVILLIVAVLVAGNLDDSHRATLTVLGKPIDATTGVLVLSAWLCGVISYFFFSVIGEIRLRARLARQKRENEQLMHELNDLRNLPLADEPAAPAEEAPREQP